MFFYGFFLNKVIDAVRLKKHYDEFGKNVYTFHRS